MVNREGFRPARADQRLGELGIELPAPPEPFGTYVEAVQTGNLPIALISLSFSSIAEFHPTTSPTITSARIGQYSAIGKFRRAEGERLP
jgi:hypothetical protein